MAPDPGAGERQTSTHYARPYRPRWLAAANALGRGLAGAGLQTRFDEESVVAAARRKTGLHFFPDEEFRLPMRRLIDALEREAALHPLGRLIVRQTLVRLLANRLRRRALCDLDPEIETLPVEAPVFIVGLQRTGTTVLHRLLALEPALRPLLSWEALNPAPLERIGQAPKTRDRRVAMAEQAEAALRRIAPDFFAIHPVEAHSPEEDVLLLDHSFYGTTPEASQNVPGFSSWLEAQDQRPGYRDLRGWIQLLLWQRPGRWLGKTPHHLEHLDALFDVFPDARIIHTHRDPQVVAASFCSMLCHARGVFSDRVDAHEVGRQWGEKQLRMLERSMAVREAGRDESFLDVTYPELVSDPMKQLRRIYDFLGIELRPEIREAMQQWLAAHPQHRLGVHRYRLEDFGIDPDVLEERVGDYRARYGVVRE